MKITITGHHLNLDDDLKLYATEKIEKLGKYSSQIVDAHAVVGQIRGAYHTELILRANHHRFFGEDVLPDARASIDSAVDKVERQLVRFKEKVQRKHKHELEPSIPPESALEEGEEEAEFEDEELEEEAEAQLDADEPRAE